MLWHIRIEPANGNHDRLGERLALEAAESGLGSRWSIQSSRGFLIEGELSRSELERAATAVLVDPVVETYSIGTNHAPEDGRGTVVHVLPKPGVTDPEAESALALLRDLGFAVSDVRTIRTYRLEGPLDAVPELIRRVLSNDAVEQAVRGPLSLDHLGQGHPYQFVPVTVPDPRPL